MPTRAVKRIVECLVIGCVLLGLILASPPQAVFAADAYYFIFTGGRVT
jgi:hypothetical protein